MNELGWLFLLFGSTVVAVDIALVVAIRRFYRKVRRSLALNSAGLRVRAGLSSGPRRDVLKLRLRLKETLDSGQAAVDLAARGGVPSGDLGRLFGRLRSEGVALEFQLRLLESENDLAVLAEALPAARHRVDEVAHLVRRLRSVVGSGLGDLSDGSLTTLRSEVDREVTAVRAGVQELQKLNGLGAYHEPGTQSSMD
jgi:hypothetical protein